MIERPPRVYTPVNVPYAMPGPHYPLGEPLAGDDTLELDCELGRYRQLKAGAVGQWASPQLQARLQGRITDWLGALIMAEGADAHVDADVDVERGPLDVMLGALQEDLVIMHRQHDGAAVRAIAAYVNLSFPSGWCPACACGKSFLAIHAPVPANAGFGGPERIAAADMLFAATPGVRFIWTLTPDDRLDRRQCHIEPVHAHGEADHAGAMTWETAPQAWLRVERQVVVPLDERTSAFLIRVYVYRLSGLEQAVRSAVATALTGMPAAVRRYKGLDHERIPSLLGVGT